MTAPVPFARRRDEVLDRAVKLLSHDERLTAGWLEGSLADGSADPYSDIDLHLCVIDKEWDAIWQSRRDLIGGIAPILAALDITGVFGIGCLLEGPVKLDVFFEREGTIAGPKRVAVKRLWGPDALYTRFTIDGDWGDAAIRHALESNVMGFLQGATWPVRLLARRQVNTYLYCEILLVETGIVPLMLLEKDRRAFHRNMFTRAKMLPQSQQDECASLIDRSIVAVRSGDRLAMRDIHLEIHAKICELGRAAFERYGMEFPARVQAAMVEFYKREWPME